jgi:hypothetical protein
MDGSGLLPDNGVLAGDGRDKKRYESHKKNGFRYGSMYSSGSQNVRDGYLEANGGIPKDNKRLNGPNILFFCIFRNDCYFSKVISPGHIPWNDRLFHDHC